MKPIDAFGDHMVERRIGTTAICLLDELVCVMIKLFRSLYIDAAVELMRLFADVNARGNIQRPDIFEIQVQEALGDK